MDPTAHERSDEALLLAAGDEPEAFALFYRRHVRALAAYFWRRSRDAEVTADLSAETFAAALDGCRRFDPECGPAIGWLYGIAIASSATWLAVLTSRHARVATIANAVRQRRRGPCPQPRLPDAQPSPRGVRQRHPGAATVRARWPTMCAGNHRKG